MNAALVVENLSKRYKTFTLDRVSFNAPAGYISGLIGPNGAGKTTIIKSIMHLIRADSGSISIFGIDAWKDEERARGHVGYIPDEPVFYDDVSLADHAKALSSFYPAWSQPRYAELIGEFGLPEKKKCKTFSQGMRIKAAIALGLAYEPELLVMDEPTSGLDPVFRKHLLEYLRDYVADGRRSVLFSTHITSDLETTADFVTFIYNGRIVFSETLESIHDRYAVVKGSNPPPEGNGIELLGGRTGTFGYEALTSTSGAFESIRSGEWSTERATLEDIMYFTKREETRNDLREEVYE